MRRKNRKNALIAAAILAVCVLTAAGVLKNAPAYVPQAQAKTIDEDRSAVYLTGEGYQINPELLKENEELNKQKKTKPQTAQIPLRELTRPPQMEQEEQKEQSSAATTAANPSRDDGKTTEKTEKRQLDENGSGRMNGTGRSGNSYTRSDDADGTNPDFEKAVPANTNQTSKKDQTDEQSDSNTRAPASETEKNKQDEKQSKKDDTKSEQGKNDQASDTDKTDDSKQGDTSGGKKPAAVTPEDVTKQKRDGDEEKGKTEEEKAALPTVQTSLIDGDEISGTKLRFWVKAKDAGGRNIPPSSVADGNILVRCNGTVVGSESETRERANYRVTLNDGRNRIEITATDGKDASRTISRTIFCNASGETVKTGTVSVTVNARIVGLGTISEGTVELEDGDNVKDALEAFFKANSIAGTFRGGYLAGISREGIADGWAIADETKEKMEDLRATELDPADQDNDSLKEHDFYSTSGWIYSVNGVFPEVGLTGTTLADGDQIDLFFQLATMIY